jgi:hypothetical protein
MDWTDPGDKVAPILALARGTALAPGCDSRRPFWPKSEGERDRSNVGSHIQSGETMNNESTTNGTGNPINLGASASPIDIAVKAFEQIAAESTRAATALQNVTQPAAPVEMAAARPQQKAAVELRALS